MEELDGHARGRGIRTDARARPARLRGTRAGAGRYGRDPFHGGPNDRGPPGHPGRATHPVRGCRRHDRVPGRPRPDRDRGAELPGPGDPWRPEPGRAHHSGDPRICRGPRREQADPEGGGPLSRRVNCRSPNAVLRIEGRRRSVRPASGKPTRTGAMDSRGGQSLNTLRRNLSIRSSGWRTGAGGGGGSVGVVGLLDGGNALGRDRPAVLRSLANPGLPGTVVEGIVDLNSITSVATTYADLVGAILIALGVLLGLIRRALGYLIVALGIVGTLWVALSGPGQGQSQTIVYVILAGGVVASVLLAIAVRTVLIAAQLLVFLGGWFLLLYGWSGLAFVTGAQGSLTWLGLSLASTAVSSRFHTRILATLPATAKLVARAALPLVTKIPRDGRS